MKKYKVIQTSPGFDIIGKEFESGICYCKEYDKYPHLFEEVIQKDWEVISTDTPYQVEQKILSVKRLSDSTEWALEEETEQGKIERFGIIDNKMTCYIGQLGYDISGLTKLKKPILITEDGVKIFDKEGFVQGYVYKTNEHFTIETHTIRNVLNYNLQDNYKWYSTKEKVQEYISENEPRYSLKDVRETQYSAATFDGKKSQIDKLKALKK